MEFAFGIPYGQLSVSINIGIKTLVSDGYHGKGRKFLRTINNNNDDSFLGYNREIFSFSLKGDIDP